LKNQEFDLINENMKNKIFLNSAVILIVSSIFACTSGPKKSEPGPNDSRVSEEIFYQWENKAMIKNTKTGEANVINLDIIAKKPFPMRAEVTSSMGFHLASIVIQEGEIQFLLPKSKKYFSGGLSSKSLRPILNLNLDPRLSIGALFMEPFPDWKCEAESGQLKTCKTSDGDQIVWMPKAGDSGYRVEINGENYESQFQIKPPKVDPIIKDSTFVLKIPDGFKSYTLKN
jgi:hypothetical protein